jgi:predicted acyltransferase
VLQRIALAYGISSLAELYLSERNLVVLCTLALVAYVCILNIGGSPDPYGVDTNMVTHIDRYLLGAGHLYRDQGVPFDPEGLLSTLPYIINVIGGFLTGKLLQKRPFDLSDLLKGMMAGCAILVLGYLWSYFDPVNKKLWTSSFTLITMGMDIMLFIAIVYWVDVRGQNFAPASFFTCFGKNPILIYLFSELLMKLLLFPVPASGETLYGLLYRHVFASAGMYPGSLLQAIAYMLLCWILVWSLNRKRFYVKI